MWILEGLSTLAEIAFFVLDVLSPLLPGGTEEERRRAFYWGLFAGGVLVLGMLVYLWLSP